MSDSRPRTLGWRPSQAATFRPRRPGKAAARPRAAFSLMELALVLAIMGVLAAIAWPRYSSSLDQYRTALAARRIAADLNLAQGRARALSASQTVSFTLTGNRYQIVGMADLDHLNATYLVDLAAPPYQVTLGSAAFGNSPAVTFNGFGVPGSGGTVVVRSGAFSRTVSLDPDSGLARLP